MTELRFHRDLYAAGAVDQAVASLADYATFERADEPKHFVVRVSAATPNRERRVAGEVSNFALGITVKERGRRR